MNSLNNEQQLAVMGLSASALVLAGAGAGKTKVLVARLKHHIDQGASFEQLLAVTFTNKAANEMKERLEQQLGSSINGLLCYLWCLNSSFWWHTKLYFLL